MEKQCYVNYDVPVNRCSNLEKNLLGKENITHEIIATDSWGVIGTFIYTRFFKAVNLPTEDKHWMYIIKPVSGKYGWDIGEVNEEHDTKHRCLSDLRRALAERGYELVLKETITPVSVATMRVKRFNKDAVYDVVVLNGHGRVGWTIKEGLGKEDAIDHVYHCAKLTGWEVSRSMSSNGIDDIRAEDLAKDKRDGHLAAIDENGRNLVKRHLLADKIHLTGAGLQWDHPSKIERLNH